MGSSALLEANSQNKESQKLPTPASPAARYEHPSSGYPTSLILTC